MENTPVQPINNPSTAPVMPPPPSPLPDSGPKKSFKLIFFVLASVVFLFVAGFTGYLYINNQNELNALNTQNYSPIETDSSGNSQQAIASNEPSDITIPEDVICARFTSVENALEYIEQACTLDLSSQNHNTLPEGISSLTLLTDINLSNNNLTTFPVELFEIDTLMNVDLSNNNISSIPQNFVLPDNIQNLNLSGNPISPSELSKYNRTPDNTPQE